MVQIGDKVKFTPLKDIRCHGVTVIDALVTGTVVMINYKHSWFSVEYGDSKMRTSFRFDDIGDKVTIVKEKDK